MSNRYKPAKRVSWARIQTVEAHRLGWEHARKGFDLSSGMDNYDQIIQEAYEQGRRSLFNVAAAKLKPIEYIEIRAEDRQVIGSELRARIQPDVRRLIALASDLAGSASDFRQRLPDPHLQIVVKCDKRRGFQPVVEFANGMSKGEY